MQRRMNHNYGSLIMADNLFIKIFSRLPMARSTRSYEFILEHIHLPPEPVILDLGAGAGHGSAFLAQALPDARIIGLDIDYGPAMSKIRPEHRNGANTPLYVQANAPEFPLADESLDAVMAMMTFHCLPQPQQVLNEATRVLRPGGALVIGDVNGEHWMGRPFEWVEHRFISPYTHAYTAKELEMMMAAAGLERFTLLRRPGKEQGFMQWCVGYKGEALSRTV